MLGAIIGDTVGSVYEFNNIRTKDFPLFSNHSRYTDDSVMTVALMDWLLHAEVRDEKSVTEYLRKWGRWDLSAGYGGRFYNWLVSDDPKPYNSFGNGSAMRISPVAWAVDDYDEMLRLVDIATKITHNHPEGMKGARTVATCIFEARKPNNNWGIILANAVLEYKEILKLNYEDLRKNYRFNETCQGSIPQALYCFLNSKDFEDCLRTTISIGGDCDTTAAISCAIAEAFYKEIPDAIVKETRKRLPKEMLVIVDEFKDKYGGF